MKKLLIILTLFLILGGEARAKPLKPIDIVSSQSELKKNEFIIFNQKTPLNKLIQTEEFKNFLRNNLPSYKVYLGVSNKKKLPWLPICIDF